jgi:hypothetical protein
LTRARRRLEGSLSRCLIGGGHGPGAGPPGGESPGFHAFRHTCATILFRQGWNAVQVQRWLGHHKPSFTLDTYVHLLDEDVPEPSFFDAIAPMKPPRLKKSKTSTSSTSTEPAIPIHNGRHRPAASDQIIPMSGAAIELPHPTAKITSSTDPSQSTLSVEEVSEWQPKAKMKAAKKPAIPLSAAAANPMSSTPPR